MPGVGVTPGAGVMPGAGVPVGTAVSVTHYPYRLHLSGAEQDAERYPPDVSVTCLSHPPGLRHSGPMHEVAISGGMIRLGQLLKLAGAVDSGADVRPLLADGLVTVNGDVETRRGRQLHPGDVITLESISVRVTGADTAVP
jgi:ribosome-associated protein